MVTNLQNLEIPDDETTASAADAVAQLSTHLRQHPTPSGRVVLCADDAPDTSVNVPATAFKLFIDVLDELAKGNAVTVVPVHAEVTTQQAAELSERLPPLFDQAVGSKPDPVSQGWLPPKDPSR